MSRTTLRLRSVRESSETRLRKLWQLAVLACVVGFLLVALFIVL